MECLHVMALHKILEQPWWAYITVFMAFFGVCLALNYAVKKLNEARMGDRLVRVLEKSSLPQSAHGNGPVITVQSEAEPRTISVKAPYSPPAISLIFDKEENKRIGDVYNMVKPLTDWSYDELSLNSEKSLETVNVLSISSDRTVGESSSIKKIECELVTAKATSSHTFSEKVVIKDKIDSYDLITPQNYSYSEIPGIAGCNTNSVTAKESGRIIIGRTSSNEPNKTVTENNSFSNICVGRMIPTSNHIVENIVKNTNIIKDKEKIDTGCLNNILSKIVNLKNKDDNPRIEKSATNTIIAKSSSSHSGSIWRETKMTSIEKKESNCIVAKESSHTHWNRGGENIPVKTSKSEPIVPKETSCDAENESDVRECIPTKNNVIMNSSSNERSHYNAAESVPFKNTECGPVLDKTDSSDLPDPVTVKNHRFEQIPGILPFTGKYLHTSKLISEKKTDILATEERAARKGSGSTLSEGTASNDPTNSVGENIPFKNIGAGRIFPTNISFTEIVVKDPKVIRDKKSDEEIDTSCLDGQDMNDDTRLEESATLSNRNVTKIRSAEKTESKEILPDSQFKRIVREYAPIARNSVKNESRLIEFKKTSSYEANSSNVTEYVPIKKSEPGRIVARQTRQTALLTRSDTNAVGRIVAEATPSHTQSPIRKSEFLFLAAEETSNSQTDDNVPGANIASLPNTQSDIKDAFIEKKESGSIKVKQTSNRQTEINVPDTDIIQMDEPSRDAVEKKSLRKLVPANNSIKYVTMQTSGSGSIVARETAPRSLSGSDLLNSIKMSESGSIAPKEIYNRQSEASAVKGKSLREPVSANNATKYVTIQTSGSGSIVAKKTSPRTLSGSDLLNSIKMSESGSVAAKEIYNRQSEASAVKKESLREPVSADNAPKYVTIQTSGSGSIVARETAPRILSGSDLLNSIKMSESGSIAAKEIYDRQSEASAVKKERLRELVSVNNATKYVTIQTSASGSIVSKNTSPRTLSGSDLLNSIKMSESGSIAAKENYDRQSEASAVKKESLREPVSVNNATKYVTIKPSGSGSIVVRETAPRTLSSSDLLNSIKISESGSVAAKEIYNRQSEASAVKKESLREPVSTDNATKYVTIQTSGSGSIVARETAPRILSGSDLLNSIKMSESGSIAAKEIYNRQSEASAVKKERLREPVSVNNATKYVTIQTSASGSIVAKKTSPRTLSGSDLLNSIKMSESESIAAKEIYDRQSEASAVKKESLREPVSVNNATKYVTIKPSGSVSIVARETAPRTLSSSDLLSSIKMSESGPIAPIEIYNRQSEASAVKAKSLRELVSANNATKYVTIKPSGSGNIVAKKTSPRTLSGSDLLNFIKMSESGSTAPKEFYNRQSEASAVKGKSLRELVAANNATKYVIVERSGSGSNAARDAASLTLSGRDVLNPLKIKMSDSGFIVLKEISKRQSKDSLPDTNVVEMDGPGPDPDTAGEEETMRVLVLANDNEDIESGNLKKSLIADTSKFKNDQQKKHPPVNHDKYD